VALGLLKGQGMSRLPLLLCWAWVLLALPARAEPYRSLGITVAPVGAFVLTGTDLGRTSGYSAGLSWSYRKANAVLEVSGHVASSRLLTEATPMSVRLVPLGDTRVRPYLGLGASLLVAHQRPVSTLSEPVSRVLQVGAELCGGVGVELGSNLFLSGEVRYQNFSAGGDPFSGARQALASAYLGVGIRL
jgi:hypothetical protein